MNIVLAAVAMTAIALPAWSQSSKKDCGPLPPVFDGIAFASDGDTIHGVGYRPGIRLWGLNAPELRDGAKAETGARDARPGPVADDLVAAQHKARCVPIEWDVYCRIVSTCTTGAGVDLTLDVLSEGLAYGFYLAKHPDHLERALQYSLAEATARKARKGLWPEWLGEK